MKKLALFLAVCLCAALCCLPVSAANRVPEMEVEVALRADGSAHVTQTWHARTDEGTEFYLARNDSGYLSITDFSVADKNGTFTRLEHWDVNATREEKAGKCGILDTPEGVELCWGIGEYGENRYTIEYVVHGLVGAYSDADGFNHRFVDDMSFFPSDLVLTIRNEDNTPLTDEDCDVWGFGFTGQVAFEDGVVRAWSEAPLERGQHATLMLSLKKGMLAPERTVDGSFEVVKARAFEGSDYDYENPDWEDEPWTLDDYLFALVFFGGIGGTVVGMFKKLFGWEKRKAAKRLKQVDYFRDIPNDGNLNATYHLGLSDRACQEDTLMGAYLLRLIADGALEPTAESVDTKKVCLQLVRPPRTGNEFDDALYTVLEAAAGEDGTLQPNELQYYYMRNRRPVIAFMDSCQSDAQRTMHGGGWLKGAECRGRRDLSETGLEQLDQIWGLKRFLLDFSLIHERGVGETVIWQDYMVYAMLLGIADKVAPQIKKLYPDATPQIEQYERNIAYAASYNQALTFAYITRVQRERSSGSGGRVSLGGGGGFSGGGRGGTR